MVASACKQHQTWKAMGLMQGHFCLLILLSASEKEEFEVCSTYDSSSSGMKPNIHEQMHKHLREMW